MIESEASLIPRAEGGALPKALCLGIEEESLKELERLLGTLSVEVVSRDAIQVRRINPATYFGSGKILELKEKMEKLGAEIMVFDVELSPNQLRNVEKALGKPVIDRPGVILEIFSSHARTREAKTQVELARLQYLLPRLAHFWTHFERQRGGIGNKGMGEKQIEVDRRLVKDRMSTLRERLKQVEKDRRVQRSQREDVLKVAIVGYTNAGKSTLLNALTDSHVRAEDKLFATLDPSVRTLDPSSHPPIVAIDTVGFIRNLPTALIASFRSTLEEVLHADMLLHVVDASSSQLMNEIQVTEQVLEQLGAKEKHRLVVLNKVDLLKSPAERNLARVSAPGAFMVSALDRESVLRLRDHVLEHFKQGMELWEVVIPYKESKLEAQLHAHGSVEHTKHLEQGSYFRLKIPGGWARKLGLERFKL
jgi:GTP-binding protein HflX